ncbi:MAG: DUF362 domain-containing protein [Pseudomonadota bacterium]
MRETSRKRIRLSRRRFLHTAAALTAAGVLLPRCSGDPGAEGPDVALGPDAPPEIGANTWPARNPDAVLLGLYPTDQVPSAVEAVRLACGSLDWSWLTPGDSVFVKLSCNSGSAHPAATSPAAVRAVCEELLARGAGTVKAGDMGGVEFVRVTEAKTWGSTRALMEQNGLLDAITGAGAEPWFFDEQGYDAGFVEATFPFDTRWPEAPRIARIATEVDHIVMLPRLSSHAIAGCSMGLKCAVGWLRDDSRYLMHVKGASLHALYTELSYCAEIRDRLRLTLTLAEALLLDCGPDVGTLAVADPRIVIASTNLANHDAVAVAALAFIDDLTPPDPTVVIRYGESADMINQIMITTLVPSKYGEPWGALDMEEHYTPVETVEYQTGVTSNPALVRAYEILGGVPATIPVRLVGEAPDPAFLAFLTAHDGGRLGPEDT